MKRLLGLAGLAALVLIGVFTAVALASGDNGNPPEPPGNHVPVAICHRDNAETKPYVLESPDNDSIIKAGHGDHTGPIFEPGMKEDKVKWGDIIPPFKWWELVNNKGEKTWVEMSYPGMNWPAGQAILESGCVVPTPPPPSEDEFAATARCDIESEQYVVSGTVNGAAAEVKPTTIAGNFAGSTEVKVRLGDVKGKVDVTTDGKCTEEQPPPQTDVCPNIEGNQEEIPAGMVKDAQGNCVTPTPHQVKGDASVSCVLPDGYYRVSGTVDGHAADKVDPATIPGNAKGSTDITVTRGDTSVKTTVSTNGDCGNAPTPPEVTPPVVTTPTTPTTPITPTTPTAPLTPPTTKPVAKKPAAKKPAAKPAPAAPKKAVAGAFAKEAPKLAYTP
jgi:hypothetical protein